MPRARRDGWLLWLEYWRAAAHDPEIATDAVEVQEAWLELVQETLRAGSRRSGTFRLDQSSTTRPASSSPWWTGSGSASSSTIRTNRPLAAIASVERAVRRMLYLPA